MRVVFMSHAGSSIDYESYIALRCSPSSTPS